MRTNKTNKIADNGAVKNDQKTPMSEETREMLFAEAVDLAYESFDDPSDDHIQTVFTRLALNYDWGLGSAGAVTVH